MVVAHQDGAMGGRGQLPRALQDVVVYSAGLQFVESGKTVASKALQQVACLR